MNLIILYRGPLSSCNYDCSYCPFAKRVNSAAELADDRLALERFVAWCLRQSDHRLSVLFTPWGEALTHRHYQEALATLSHSQGIERVCIQTNLSCSIEWVADCDLSRLALWATFHPTETSLERFVAKCRQLDQRGVRFSVGIVGMRENFSAAERLRCELPNRIYLWINANKDVANYYGVDDIERLETIDPWFRINLPDYSSFGKECRTGESVFSVDGAGTMYRCHFVRRPIGNIYDADFERYLQRRPCERNECGCHIGFLHLDSLGLYQTFANGLIERIPAAWPQ